ncbi:MAG: hypothetical protein IPL40_07285 [Proteobacteria bacterium]|nr:hypothetical protein [Pseudomonadota bacterium]
MMRTRGGLAVVGCVAALTLAPANGVAKALETHAGSRLAPAQSDASEALGTLATEIERFTRSRKHASRDEVQALEGARASVLTAKAAAMALTGADAERLTEALRGVLGREGVAGSSFAAASGTITWAKAAEHEKVILRAGVHGHEIVVGTRRPVIAIHAGVFSPAPNADRLAGHHQQTVRFAAGRPESGRRFVVERTAGHVGASR